MDRGVKAREKGERFGRAGGPGKKKDLETEEKKKEEEEQSIEEEWN